MIVIIYGGISCQHRSGCVVERKALYGENRCKVYHTIHIDNVVVLMVVCNCSTGAGSSVHTKEN